MPRHSPKPMRSPSRAQYARMMTSSPSSRNVRSSPVGSVARWDDFASDRFSEMNGRAYRQSTENAKPMETDARTNSVRPVS